MWLDIRSGVRRSLSIYKDETKRGYMFFSISPISRIY